MPDFFLSGNDFSVFHLNNPLGFMRKLHIVGYYQQGLIKIFAQIAEYIKYNIAVLFVEITRWLIPHNY